MTDKLGNICGDVLNNINVKKENETMINEREYIVAKAKELGITAEELGIEPRVETIRDEQFIHEVSEYIKDREDEEVARDYINEKYWDDLGILPEKKYKIVECRLSKTIYKNVMVAIPEDEDNDFAENCLDNVDYDLDTESPDDEDDWEVDDCYGHENDLTERQIKDSYDQDDIWNYDDFAE